MPIYMSGWHAQPLSGRHDGCKAQVGPSMGQRAGWPLSRLSAVWGWGIARVPYQSGVARAFSKAGS
jgi:hypothetical protein